MTNHVALEFATRFFIYEPYCADHFNRCITLESLFTVKNADMYASEHTTSKDNVVMTVIIMEGKKIWFFATRMFIILCVKNRRDTLIKNQCSYCENP